MAGGDAGRDGGLERRVTALRGRLALSRALEDLQPGLAAGAAVALVLGLLRWLDLAAVPPGVAVAAAAAAALAFPLAGVLRRRTSAHAVAALVDHRLGLAERTATALALGAGTAPPTPLAPLVDEDALRTLDAVPPAALRAAFAPRARWAPLGGAAAALLLAALAFDAEPLRAAEAKPKDLAAAHRERVEKEEAQKAARRVLEAAREAEEKASAKEAALRALAAEMRRQSEQVQRRNPPLAEAMAAFQKMGELARERQELLAGVAPSTLEKWRQDGLLSKADPGLERLLRTLLGADMKSLNADLASLDAALKGAEGAGEWTPESLASLKERLEALAEALERSAAALEGRDGMKEGLQILGDAELLRKIAERMAELMKTLQEQGWEACRSAGGLDPDGDLGDFEPGEPIYLTEMELQAMLDRIEQMLRMAELGQLAFCQNCGLTGGT